MDRVTVNGVELEYAAAGFGDAVLLVGNGPIADGFLPLQSERALTGRYRLIRYRQRGQAGGPRAASPVTFAEHAADAASLLRVLDISRVHVVGHSTGAIIALELAAARPDLVQTVSLLEPPIPDVPAAASFFERAAKSFAAYEAGHRREAMAGFLSLASSLDWPACERVIERRVPGGVQQAIDDADVVFESYLPALGAWHFDRDRFAAMTRPSLSVIGTDSDRFFAEGHDLVRRSFPQCEECVVEGAAHLLHLQRPTAVAEGLAAFLARHTMVESRASVSAQ